MRTEGLAEVGSPYFPSTEEVIDSAIDELQLSETAVLSSSFILRIVQLCSTSCSGDLAHDWTLSEVARCCDEC